MSAREQLPCWVLVGREQNGAATVQAFLNQDDAKRAQRGWHGQASYQGRTITTDVVMTMLDLPALVRA